MILFCNAPLNIIIIIIIIIIILFFVWNRVSWVTVSGVGRTMHSQVSQLAWH